MKRIIFFIILSAIAWTAYTQPNGNRSHQQPPIASTPPIQDKNSKWSRRVNDIDKQIDALKEEIHEEYSKKKNFPLYSDKKYRAKAFSDLDQEKASLRNKVNNINNSISNIEDSLQWVNELRDYYEKGNIEDLYAHSDLTSLNVHKQILGKKYPIVMDELQILLECSEALKKEYKEDKNQLCLSKLEKVRECRTKGYLEKTLSLNKDIFEEVDNWLKDKDYSLYSMATEIAYINDNYSVDLESDFPYLANKIRKEVQENLKEKVQTR